VIIDLLQLNTNRFSELFKKSIIKPLSVLNDAKPNLDFVNLSFTSLHLRVYKLDQKLIINQLKILKNLKTTFFPNFSVLIKINETKSYLVLNKQNLTK